mgnify:FL=1|jgi:hypothetical protein
MKRFVRNLAKVFMSQTQFERDMMTYAKTEYKKDWQYAYSHMVRNNGNPPPNTHIQGVTL